MSVRPSVKILIILASLAGLLLSACVPANKPEADLIRPVADKIAGYALPEGYSEQFAVDLFDYQLVSLQGPTENCHIYLVQAPEDIHVDFETLEKQVPSRRYRNGREVKVVETRTASLRGQEVTVLVGEGTNSENQPYREVTALFDGRNGPALVSFSAPVAQWNWDQVDAFLASLN